MAAVEGAYYGHMILFDVLSLFVTALRLICTNYLDLRPLLLIARVSWSCTKV
jgi:hypothetical protein